MEDDFALTFETGTSHYREPDGCAAWETFSKGYGPLRVLAGTLDEARREELRREFVAFHESFSSDLGICVPMDYLIVRGIRR